MDDTPHPTVWPLVSYADPAAALRFLVEAFGFEETLVVHADEADPASEIVHAELRWPPGGGVMFGTTNPDSVFARPAGAGSVYCVTDQPDGRFEQATKAGAGVVQGLKDEDYGSRGFSVSDPEGNLWSFGTYRGAP